MPIEESRECPHCLTPLEKLEGGAERRCPVCQYSERRCPSCGGSMVKQVLPPAGVGIEDDGLPLELCEIFWVCRSEDCGNRLEAEP